MSIQIEEGKFYRTRAGAKVGPVVANPDPFMPSYPWLVLNAVLVEGLNSSWTSEGKFYVAAGGRYADHDIVAEWTDADEAASKEPYPFTEVAWTPEEGLTSRKIPLREVLVENGEGSFTEEADAPLRDGDYFVYTGAPPSFVAALKTEPMRVQILHEGARLTSGERDAEYGPPAVNMAAAGALKAAFRAHMTRDISLAELEAIDMALTKLGRIATGQKVKRDTFVDCATYIAIAGEIALAEWAVFLGEKKGPEA